MDGKKNPPRLGFQGSGAKADRRFLLIQEVQETEDADFLKEVTAPVSKQIVDFC